MEIIINFMNNIQKINISGVCLLNQIIFQFKINKNY